jgi:hypothetical protein
MSTFQHHPSVYMPDLRTQMLITNLLQRGVFFGEAGKNTELELLVWAVNPVTANTYGGRAQMLKVGKSAQKKA